MAQNKNRSENKTDEYKIFLAAIMLLGLFLSVYFFYGPSPINGADNYIYATAAYQLSHGQFGQVAGGGVLDQQYILIAGIGIFFLLFGASPLTSALFGILCFLATIFVVYMIGEKLYSKRAGILCALFYSFNPLAVVNASYVGDNGPMALFVSLCVLFLVLGIKEKESRYRNYVLSGFFGLIGILVTIQSIIILAFAVMVLLACLLIERKRSYLKNIKGFAVGLIIAFCVIAILGLLAALNPLYIIDLNVHAYSTLAGATPQLSQYLEWLFPFNLQSHYSTLVGYFSSGNIQSALSSASKMIASDFLTPSAFQYAANQSEGLFGYFAAASAIYLALRLNRSVLIPSAWLAITLLYLGMGTASLTSYVPILYAYPRLMMLFLPAIALLIGFAANDVLCLATSRGSKAIVLAKRIIGSVLLPIGLVLSIFLFANSVLIVQYIDLSQYHYVLPMMQVGTYIDSLPQNAIVYTRTDIPVIFYTGFRANILGFDTSNYDCSILKNGSYVAIPINPALASACNLQIAYFPTAMPNSTYSLFNTPSVHQYYNLTVYRR
ncbi:MAG: glycosyltransferase family 39 protein [Candidatus Micrarchaeota archaeon]|nr:glycosyltransferase family 39 protein [Candidatus Micrarchaeota archaeon]